MLLGKTKLLLLFLFVFHLTQKQLRLLIFLTIVGIFARCYLIYTYIQTHIYEYICIYICSYVFIIKSNENVVCSNQKVLTYTYDYVNSVHLQNVTTILTQESFVYICNPYGLNEYTFHLFSYLFND